jgi:hypothetical protein
MTIFSEKYVNDLWNQHLYIERMERLEYFPLCWQPGVCVRVDRECPLVMMYFLNDTMSSDVNSVPEWCPVIQR